MGRCAFLQFLRLVYPGLFRKCLALPSCRELSTFQLFGLVSEGQRFYAYRLRSGCWVVVVFNVPVYPLAVALFCEWSFRWSGPGRLSMENCIFFFLSCVHLGIFFFRLCGWLVRPFNFKLFSGCYWRAMDFISVWSGAAVLLLS